MKNLVAAALALLLSLLILGTGSAVPAFEFDELPDIDVFDADVQGYRQPLEPETGLRFRRATCDLLSVSTPWGSVNHAACAAHCLAMRRGYRGGRCRDGVCHCRR